MKQQILAQIADKLSALGISAQYGAGADISIRTNFFDAGWGTGSKKIDYEASVFLDEQKQTAFMYEKTTETGRGLSFGSDEETSFQSGKTLFRKVKGVRYGPDGQSVEYDLDLGAIPSAVKETAKRFGWSFKTVLKKEKAMYPAGYVPAVSFASAPATPAPAAPAAARAIPETPAAPTWASVPAAAPAVVSAAATSDAGEKRTFCTNCGAPLAPGAAFCTVCGTPVKPASGAGSPVKSAFETGVPAVSEDAHAVSADSPVPASGYGAPASSWQAPAPAYGQAAPGAPVRKKRRGIWQLITLGVLAALFAAVYALAGVSFFGWLLFLIVIALNGFFLFRLKGGKTVAGIALLAVSAVVLFLGLAFAAGPSDDHPEQTGGINAEDTLDAAAGTAGDIAFSKTYPLDGGGSLLAEITTDGGKYDVALTLTIPNSILPEDFLLSGEGDFFEYEGFTLQDMEFLEAFLCDSEGDTFYSASAIGPTYVENGLAEESSTYLTIRGRTAEEFRAFAETYDMFKVFRYRAMEVGIRDFQTTEENGYAGYSYGYNSELAYNLHPALLEIAVPWDDFFAEAGIS
jgi:hypothetical protein